MKAVQQSMDTNEFRMIEAENRIWTNEYHKKNALIWGDAWPN